MMRWNSFARSLVFAAAAALGLAAAVTLLAPVFGPRAVLLAYIAAAAALYGAGLAPSLRASLRAGAVGAGLAFGLWLLPLGLQGTAMGAAAIVSIVRSGVVHRMRPLRAALAEVALGGGGLALAALLADGGLASLALGVWGFFLVQSLYFLIGGVGTRGDESQAVDPFERARARLLALLD